MIRWNFFALIVFTLTLLTSCVIYRDEPRSITPTPPSQSTPDATGVINPSKPTPVASKSGATNTSAFSYEVLFNRNVERDPELASLPCKPYDLTLNGGTTRTWRCPSLGIEFQGPVVKKVFLFPPNEEFPTGYQGALPFGLTWADTRQSIEQKIGVGDAKDRTSYVNYQNQSGREIMITYQQDTHYQSGSSAQMRSIAIGED